MAHLLRRVGILGTATAAAQVVAALNLVVIARILAQEDVGHYSVFVSYAFILLPVSLLSYEVLLPNVPEQEVPWLLHGLLLLAGAVAMTAALAFGLFGYLHAVPLAGLLFAMAVLRMVEFSGIRAQRVAVIALARLLPHLSFLVFLGAMAWGGRVFLDVVLWLQVLAFALSAAMLVCLALRRELRSRPAWAQTLRLLRGRWRNPVLFAPSEIASTVAWNLPVALVARNFGEAMAAQYGVMLRYALAPVGLMNSVVGNVYHAELAQGVRERRPELKERFQFIRRRMFWLGLATGIATALLLPPILRLLLGPGWETAEELVRIMAPLVAVAVWISPFGVAFYVFERSKELLLLNLAYVAIAVTAFLLVTEDLRLAAAVFVLLSCARFLVMLGRVEAMLRQSERV